jgi:DUF917 family protein
LSNYDVECIGIGAGILGCGGGGSPHLGKLLTKKALAEGKTIKIVNPHTFYANKHQSDDMVVEIAYMGAQLEGYQISLIQSRYQGLRLCL